MSREILFRGKRTDNGEWVEGSLLIDYISGQYFIHTNGNSVNKSNKIGKEGCLKFLAFEVDPETVGQYTGLTDKNGRKIFEGDIIRYTDKLIGRAKVDQVKYNETHASFCKLHKSKMGLQYLLLCEYDANRCEVIGNIFDNPELLEGE